MNTQPDAIELARALIRCPSVTPEDGGALASLRGALEALGFQCHSLPFAEDGTAEVQNHPHMQALLRRMHLDDASLVEMGYKF